MAEENENEIVEEKGGIGLPTVILGTLGGLLLGAMGAIFGADLMNDKADPASEDAAVENGEELADGSRVKAKTDVVDLGEFSLNLKDPSTQLVLNAYLKYLCTKSYIVKIDVKFVSKIGN